MRFGLRELLFMLVLLAMPVAAYFFVFEPRNVQIVEAREEIARKQAKLQTLAEATAGIGDIEVEIQKLRKAIAHFEGMLPSQRELDTLLRKVWDLAGEHGLRATSVRPDTIVKAAQYSEMPIQMVIVGDFDGFYSFVQDIEKLPRITRMPRLNISKQTGDAQEEGVIKAELTLSIFFEDTRTQTAGR